MESATTFDPVAYNRTARALHWIMALLVIVNLGLGLFHDALPDDWKVIPVHKSIGMTVLALALVRLGWRLTHRPPPLPADMPQWERAAATASHVSLYTAMLFLPLTGWIMSSASPRPVSWSFLFDFPKFAVEKGAPLQSAADVGHAVLGYATAALALIHIGAALRHHFVLRDAILRRMLAGAGR